MFIGGVAVVVVPGCSYLNPAYDPDGEGEAGATIGSAEAGTEAEPTRGTSADGLDSDSASNADDIDSSGDVPACDDPDVDDDGVVAVACGGTDCDDDDPAVHPGAEEVCDDVDDDCDPTTLGTVDDDGDGLISSACCNPSDAGPPACGLDCDDWTPGPAIGTWRDCEACGVSCPAQQACEVGACIPARRVFISSTLHTGNLGGYAGADAQCQSRADEVGLGGSFSAFLSGPPPGLARLEQPGVPLVRLDGVRVADDWLDLVDGNIAAPVNRDEHGGTVQGNAWTGLPGVFGSLTSDSCIGWTYEAGGCLEGSGFEPCGAAGQSDRVDENWDGHFVFHCNAEFRLYCLEQGM